MLSRRNILKSNTSKFRSKSETMGSMKIMNLPSSVLDNMADFTQKSGVERIPSNM